MRKHVQQETATLLRRFAFQVNRASRSADDECVHDLRVAIRRLSSCLRVFSEFYPHKSAKKVRRELAGLRDAAGAVRDCDITLELLDAAGIPGDAPMVQQLQEERRKAGQELLHELHRWKARGFSRKWRLRLDLTTDG